MIITKPELPAKAGYVEIVDGAGNHVYKPTQETIEKQKMSGDITANKNDADEQLTNLQLALCEAYEGSDKQLTDLQTALCEVYELVLGGGAV
jgi:hypothetical protein